MVLGNGHLLDQVLRRSDSSENSPQGAWDHVAEEMLLEFTESGHPIFRATTPLSKGNLKSKVRGKLSLHFAADQNTIDTIYRIILSVNLVSVYGAVAAVCEEFEGHQDRSGELVILMGQSIVLGEVKAEVLVHDEDPMLDQILCSSTFNKLNRFHQKTKFAERKLFKSSNSMATVHGTN